MTRLLSTFSVSTCTAGFLMALAFTEATAATPGPDLECKMSIPARVQTTAKIPLTFELINRSKATMNVLNWNTPLEGFYGAYLQITGPEGEVEYRGRVVKRGSTPTREEYVSIRRGGRITKVVNLAPAYDFKGRGRHEIVFTGKLLDATKGKIPRAFDQQTSLEVNCPNVSFDLATVK